jgi:hypothetical protein
MRELYEGLIVLRLLTARFLFSAADMEKRGFFDLRA